MTKRQHIIFLPTLSHYHIITLTVVFLFSCQNSSNKKPSLFTSLPPDSTGITFSNTLSETDSFNIVQYLYAYNGGGVAVLDVDKNGLPDIFFTSNQQANALYLNRGNWQFEDITEKAGLGEKGDWSTGVSVCDVNVDGWPDLYVCEVADYKGLKGRNRLFVHQGLDKNGLPVFEEKAAEYGLDARGFGQKAVWLDYDQDGDLDMFLLQHTVHNPTNYEPRNKALAQRDSASADRLFRNDDARFFDVSEAAGLNGGRLGYGLDVSVADINLDGWPDLFISNDFHENDYLYLNQKDGSFREVAAEVFSGMSQFSMGNTVADLNADGLPEIASLDMRPPTDSIRKRSEGPNPFDIFEYKLTFGYAPQLPRNHLHLHAGVGPEGNPRFNEACCAVGLEATDWSWSILPADFNLDGRMDLFITNGIPRRLNDLDYLRFLSNSPLQSKASDLELMQQMPEGFAENALFVQQEGFRFADSAATWGLNDFGASHGAAVADFDNDGDLDLVVNHLNKPAGLYRNELKKKNYLVVELEGPATNPNAIGAKVEVFVEGKRLVQENYPGRGWLSCGLPELWFGLGENERVDSLSINNVIMWQYDKVIKEGGRLKMKLPAAGELAEKQQSTGQMIEAPSRLDFIHREDKPRDLRREPLMPHVLSTQGPAFAIERQLKGHIFIGGAQGQAGKLHIGGLGHFDNMDIESDKKFEDTDAVFFDSDGDGKKELYVGSGGNVEDESLLQDRLFFYKNDFAKPSDSHSNNYTEAPGRLPAMPTNSSCVRPYDYDGDGDIDIFVGGRSVVGAYGKSPRSYLLENDGKGFFTDKTAEIAPVLEEPGMVTDARWADLNGDGKVELVVVGEWMKVSVFGWDGEKITAQDWGTDNTTGWWNRLIVSDIDGDGDLDLMVGNRGLNGVLRASAEAPVWLHTQDIDQNGTIDPIISYMAEGKRKPFADRDALAHQLPKLKKRFLS
jgi:hypothetical protein